MNQSVDDEQALDIRMMLPEDAPGVVELYRSVYGNEYPVKAVYDVDGIIEQQRSGDMIRIVAVNKMGRVLGQVAAYRSCVSNPELYEEGQGIVLMEYRNRGILDSCIKYGHDHVYPQIMEQMWGEAVCNHVYTQKAEVSLGCYETGIELDLMPAATYQKEKSSSGRVAGLIMCYTYKPLSQTVFLPEIYKESLRYLYSGCDFGHRFLSASEPLPLGPTKGRTDIYAGAGVARFTISELGSDLEEFLLQQEKEAASQSACILQLYLNLASPSTGTAVEILRQHHYFLGGVLPRWFDSDGLLMQKVLHEPNLAGIHLYTDRAKRILEIIEADRRSVMA